jgi:hypothetical protein
MAQFTRFVWKRLFLHFFTEFSETHGRASNVPGKSEPIRDPPDDLIIHVPDDLLMYVPGDHVMT